MEKIKLEFDKKTFNKYGVWMLRPEKLSEMYGKINFKTIKFFDISGKEFIPEGGGLEKYINVTHIYKDKDTFVEFDEEDFFPDPWVIKCRTIFIAFNLKK